MPYYSKNLNGDCEEDRYGKFNSIALCQANERSPVYEVEFDRWVVMQAIIQDDDLFFELAPSDRREYVWQRFGLRLSEEDNSREIGEQLITDDLVSLYLHSGGIEVVADYLSEKLDELDMFLLKAIGESHYSTFGVDPPMSLKWYRARFHKSMLGARVGNTDPELARWVQYYLTVGKVKYSPENTPRGVRIREYIVSQLPILRRRYVV